jgi:hypothetical protein
MRAKYRAMTVAILAVLAMATVGIAQASAHEFKASAAGILKGKKTTAQIFDTNSGSFECSEATSEAKVKAGSQSAFIDKVSFSGCKFFGFSFTTTVAEFELGANESAYLLNKVTMSVIGAGCTMTLEPNKEAKTGAFANLSGGKMEATMELLHIHFVSTGGLCGESGNMAFVGKSALELPGGTIEWK